MDAYCFVQFFSACILLVITNVEPKHHHGLVASPSTNSETSIVLPLFHRDDPSNPLKKKVEMQRELGRGEKLVAMVRRDAMHIQVLSARVGGAMKGGSKRENRHVRVQASMGENASAPVSNGLSDGSGEFFTTMGIGYRDFLLVMDTGSDLVWLQCLPCENCYEQTDPLFDPAFSSTFSPVNCQSESCSQADIMTCRRRICEYQQSYGDGSFTIGSIVRDTFYTSNRSIINNGVVMGCGHDNEGLFVGAAGLLGLGRGPLSFPSQVAEQTGGVFSYCLSSTGPGALIFGRTSEENEESENRVYTPLLRNPIRELTYYYVPLVGISIGGQMVEGIDASNFMLRESGRGGVILDSGTTITRFVEGVYYPMRDAYREAASMRGYRPAGSYSIFDTCYFAPTQLLREMPIIELHFEGGSLISLGPQNSMYPIDDAFPLLCLAFAPTTSDFSILGNVQQQGFLITFDTRASRLGFLNNQCSPPPIS